MPAQTPLAGPVRRPDVVSWLLSLLVLLGGASAAHAHALGVECRLRDNRVHVEAFYDDDTPAVKARVRIVDAMEQEIAKGETDAMGRWSFPEPPPGTYEVVVDAGGGHRATSQVTIRGGSRPAETQISAGQSRTEFTQFPWLKVLLGLGVIGAVAATFTIMRSHGKPRADG